MFNYTHKFSCDHAAEGWRFTNEQIACREEADGGWFAIHPKLGCSVTRGTPEDAITNLLLANGCTDITVEDTRGDEITQKLVVFKRKWNWHAHLYFSDGSHYANWQGPWATKTRLLEAADQTFKGEIVRGYDE